MFCSRLSGSPLIQALKNFEAVLYFSSSNIHTIQVPVLQRKAYHLIFPNFSRTLDNKPFAYRQLETISHISPTAAAVTKDDKREFMAVFPDIVRDLTDTQRNLELPEIRNWFSKVLQYNVSGGKRLRGLTLVYSYRMLASPEELTPENIHLSHILGWCVEMLQAFFLVVDDVMDKSETRRGRLCWYRQPEVGLRAVNDALLIESGIYQLLKKHFQQKPYYNKLVDLFHETSLKTELGQTLDFMTANNSENRFDKFTMDRYNSIVKYKTAYYSFHLPVALAMHMAGVTDEEKHRQAKSILLQMGHFFQVQDDYMDVFGDTAVTGKIGSDIQDGKCTWLSVVALQRATAEQRKILKECYGKQEKESVTAVKQLYIQLGLPAIFTAYEEESYNMITTMIQQLSRGMPDDLFFTLLHKIYKRVN